MKFITVLASLPLAAAFAPNSAFSNSRVSTELDAATIQFVRGLEEKVVPDVKLTRARDGSSGNCKFVWFVNHCEFNGMEMCYTDFISMLNEVLNVFFFS